MSFKQSYEQELQHIRTTAKEYAEKNPSIAPFLGNQSNDQDVERLIEAFAFTTAKLQARIDDGIPELSQDIIRTTWPQMLDPITSKSIVQFSFNKSMKDAFHHIPINQEITCKKNDQIIGFNTIYPLTLCAIDLVNG
jgi:type VI secretion system protein ImpG